MKFVNQNLFSLFSLGILVGISQAAIAMDAEPTVKRDQYFRKAKANPINYAEEDENLLNPKKRAREDQNREDNNHSPEHRQPKPQKSVANTRGYYTETNIPRLNLPTDRPSEVNYDHYSFLMRNVAYLEKARTLAKKNADE